MSPWLPLSYAFAELISSPTGGTNLVLIWNELSIVWEWNGRMMPRKSEFLSRAWITRIYFGPWPKSRCPIWSMSMESILLVLYGFLKLAWIGNGNILQGERRVVLWSYVPSMSYIIFHLDRNEYPSFKWTNHLSLFLRLFSKYYDRGFGTVESNLSQSSNAHEVVGMRPH